MAVFLDVSNIVVVPKFVRNVVLKVVVVLKAVVVDLLVS